MRDNLIFGSILIFCLSFNIPAYAQLELSREKPIRLVEKKLNGLREWHNDEERIANDPKKWVASSQKGDVSIIGWMAQASKNPDIYLVSYTFRESKDAVEKGWWWEADTKDKIVRIVLHDPELKIKYGKGGSNETRVELLKGMSEFTVKTLYGEPDENDNGSNINTWVYHTSSNDNQQALLKITFVRGEVFAWEVNNQK